MIRAIVHQEMYGDVSHCTHGVPSTSSVPGLREMVKEELAAMPVLLPPVHHVAPSTPSYSEVAGRTPLPLSPLTAQPSSGYVAAMPRVPSSPPYFPANRMPPLIIPCATIAAFEVTSPGFVDVANGMNDVATPPMNGNTWPRITTATGRVRRSPSPPQSSDVPRSSRGQRARSPSPGRRTVSPLRPASYVSDHRLEN